MKTPDALRAVGRARERAGDRLAGLPRPVRALLFVLLAVFFFALPLLNPPLIATTRPDFGGLMFAVASYALIALGLNIVIGYAGLLDLGYVGFYAVGAYTTGLLTVYHASWPYLLVLPISVIVTMISGVLLGAPTLRVRGDYLAIVTLGFGEIIRIVATQVKWLGGSAGISQIPSPPSLGPDGSGTKGGLFQIPHLVWINGQPVVDLKHKTAFLKFGVLDAIPYYWIVVAAIILVLIVDVLLKSSRVGRAWEATREDEDAAELMGVPTFRYKLLAFALGAAIGGLSGSFFAVQNHYLNPQTFAIQLSELFVAAVIVGGAGNRWGAIFGGAIVAYLPQRFLQFDAYHNLIFGVALMVIVIFRPQGLLPPRRARRAIRAEQANEELEEGVSV